MGNGGELGRSAQIEDSASEKGRGMNQCCRQCLESNKIKPFSRGKRLATKELSVAGSDLSDARLGFGIERYKWPTIQAYYAMFHAGRALIYSRGYREKSHYCLGVALRELFVEEDLMDAQAVRDFLDAMTLREAADYEARFSQSGAAAAIGFAERFIETAMAMLSAPAFQP
jgi:uncharacterized protein (UPF0332 family)